MTRAAAIRRTTRETDITLTLTLDGTGRTSIRTGVGFLDHMLDALATHARFDLDLACAGDLHIDDHHTAEDCAIVLGQAIDRSLADRSGIERFGHAYAPLDESLARAVVDLATRPHASIDLPLRSPRLGTLASENIPHVLSTLALHGRFCLHIDLVRGTNDHHKAESAFKALALALRRAVARSPIPGSASTKGAL